MKYLLKRDNVFGMKVIIQQLLDDFYERSLPKVQSREMKFTLLQGKATIIIGMRRTGKTFFCYQQMQSLLGKGISPDRLLYLNFEDDRLLGFHAEHFQIILDLYYTKFPDNRDLPCYFFFDEIQRIEYWESFVRRLLDTENIRICLTGSSSKLLSSEIATSLRGRGIRTEMFPYNFSEFLRHQGLFESPPVSFGIRTAAKLRKAVLEYMQIGGFPEIQQLDSLLRNEILQGYVDSVLLKDVVERYRVSNALVLKHLVHHVMHASGSKFSINKFYNTLKSQSIKCTKNKLYEYLDYLMEAYLFYQVPIHSRSEKARLINPAKIYTIDTGLLAAMSFRNSSDRGPLLENLVFIHLRRLGYGLEYVHPEKGGEIDFFARHPLSGKVKFIQVCWDISDPETLKRELKGLNNGMAEFGITHGTIVTFDDEVDLADDTISVIPVWKWLLDQTLTCSN